MWFVFALLSAVFAALTSILAKIGIVGVNSNLATAIRTMVVLVMAWGMVFLTNTQGGIAAISKKSWLFLILSGLATGASWLCYYRALQISQHPKLCRLRFVYGLNQGSHGGTWEDENKSEDEILAKEVPDIDLIISGHTHTELKEAIQHGNTYIVSCGEYGRNLGSLSMTQASKNICKCPISQRTDFKKSICLFLWEKSKKYFSDLHMQLLLLKKDIAGK